MCWENGYDISKKNFLKANLKQQYSKFFRVKKVDLKNSIEIKALGLFKK